MLAYRLTDFLADLTTNVSPNAVNSFIEKEHLKRKNMFNQQWY